MVTNNTYEYGIKYKVLKVSKDEFLMIPISLEGGLSDGFDFSTGDAVFPIANGSKDLKGKYVMDNVYTTEDLEEVYDYGDDTDFLSTYFFDDYKNTLYLVKVNEDDSLDKYEIDLKYFEKREYDSTYFLDDKGHPAVTLNTDSIDEILRSDDIKEIKVLLNKYKDQLNSLKEYKNEKGITKVSVKDGKITSFETEKEVVNTEKNKKNKVTPVPFGGVEVSYEGLEKALKERIFGHDEELEIIAQKLYMNYTAKEGETVESILIVGPTGTGKTETVRAASEYLCIPYFEMNAADLVPQGIRGTSINDVLKALIDKAGGDIKIAQRGIVFLDEFDKFPDSDLDIKQAVKGILLTFLGGGVTRIEDDNNGIMYFDSRMTNKILGGVFEKISENKRSLGFGAENVDFVPLGDSDEIRQKIIDKGYYTQEELTRIHAILGYNELTRETKKNALLNSRLSEYFKKKERYKRQFGIDLVLDDEFIDTILDILPKNACGMRNVNNYFLKSVNKAEREILRNEKKGLKRLVLTKDTALNSKKYDLS